MAKNFTPKLGMRPYFSSYWLWASGHLIELATMIESTHTGRSKFDIRQRTYVANSILSSVSFIEAAVNELFQDASDNHDSYIKSLSTDSIARLSGFLGTDEERELSVVEKYDKALELCNKEQFNTGSKPYQDAALVTKLRNEIVHYKPETSYSGETSKLERTLVGKFDLNPLITTEGNPLFPDRFLGSYCAIWARDACKLLADEFFSKLGIKPNYQIVSFE